MVFQERCSSVPNKQKRAHFPEACRPSNLSLSLALSPARVFGREKERASTRYQSNGTLQKRRNIFAGIPETAERKRGGEKSVYSRSKVKWVTSNSRLLSGRRIISRRRHLFKGLRWREDETKWISVCRWCEKREGSWKNCENRCCWWTLDRKIDRETFFTGSFPDKCCWQSLAESRNCIFVCFKIFVFFITVGSIKTCSTKIRKVGDMRGQSKNRIPGFPKKRILFAF